MELKYDLVWGIEIGTNSFSAVQLKKTKTGIIIKNHHVFNYEKSIESDTELVGFAKQGLMSLFGDGVIKKKDPIVVSLPGRNIFSRPIELPPMDMRKFYELIKYEASQQIPHNLDEVVWDYHLDQQEDNVSAILFAAHRDEIQRVIEIFSSADLKIVGIQSSILAVLNYFRHDVDFDKPCVLVDVKSKNIDFVVNDGTQFWQRNIARGGDDINKALMNKFKIPFAQAEELKRNMDSGKQAEKISQVIQPIFKLMTNEISRSIGHYVNQHEDVQIADGFLLGSSNRMKAMISYYKKNLRLALHPLKKLGRLAENCEVDLDSINKVHSEMVIPLGLALQGIGEATINVNLLPPEIIEARVTRKRSKWLVFSALLFLAAGGINFMALRDAQIKIAPIVSEPAHYTKVIKTMSLHYTKQKTLVAPVEVTLKKWKRNYRDRQTFMKRDAMILALREFSKTIKYKEEDKKKNIYINYVKIEEVEDGNDISLPTPVNIPEIGMQKGVAAATGTIKERAEKVFKFTVKGTFFSKKKSEAGTENQEFGDEKIIVPLNKNNKYFKFWNGVRFAIVKDEKTGVEMCQFEIEGLFVSDE